MSSISCAKGLPKSALITSPRLPSNASVIPLPSGLSAAITLGAKWVERHFTLNRTWKGTDHAASLEPDGMRKLVRDIHNVSKTFNYKQKEILDLEEVQRNKLKWSVS